MQRNQGTLLGGEGGAVWRSRGRSSKEGESSFKFPDSFSKVLNNCGMWKVDVFPVRGSKRVEEDRIKGGEGRGIGLDVGSGNLPER